MERRLRDKLAGGTFRDVEHRHRNVARAVRSTGNKSTERTLRAALVRAGVQGWTMHAKVVQGKPDFYFLRQRVAIFVDGCFWHGCGSCGRVPKKNSGYWHAKIEGNRARDERTTAALSASGTTVLRFWEHEVTCDVAWCVARVREAVARAGG